MSKKIKMVAGDEKCPCGSGKLYRDCCLRGQARYFRDESGQTVKFNLDCMPKESVSASQSKTPPAEGECDHDCEHCTREHQHPSVAVVITEDGKVFTSYDTSDMNISELKLVIAHISVVEAKLIKALVDPNHEPLKGTSVPVMLAGHDEDEDFVFAGEESFVGLPVESIEAAIGALGGMRLDLTLVLFRTGMNFGFHYLTDDDDDDEDE